MTNPALAAAAGTHDLNDVTVIVVSFNSAHCMPRLGELLRDFPHVSIVDNGSEDDTAHAVAEHLPQALWLPQGRNLGFGAANNRALALVQTPFALMLNPDCELDTQSVRALLAVADQFPEAAMVAPQLMQAHGKPEVNYRWPADRWKSSGPAATGTCCVGFICGAAILARMSLFTPDDWFDERFFLYYEDDDLCLRLFQKQRSLLLAPQIHATHRSRGSVRGKHPWRHEYVRGYHHAQSKLIFASKHQGIDQARAQRSRLLLETVLALPLRLLLPSPRLVTRMWGRLCGLIQWKP